MGSPGYRIVRATVSDRPRMVEFLRRHFFTHEPLYMSLGGEDVHPCLDMVVPLSIVRQRISLMALEQAEDGREEIIAVCLNYEATPTKTYEEACCPMGPVDTKIVALFEMILKAGHHWKATGVDKMIDIYFLSVDPSKQRRGIGKALAEQTFRMAKEEGYPAVSMHCTSHYSALIAEKLGMRCVHELKYAEYLGEDGCPVFNLPPPHVALKSYVHVIRSPGYRIVRATVDDRPRLVKFLRQHFYRNEPLNICLGRVEGPTCSNMISQITSLHEGTSLMALELAEDGREEIIGVCLNGAATPIKKGTDTCCPLDSVIAKLVALFSVVRKRGDIWKVTGVEKMLDIQGLTVDPSKQGQGIGKALVEQAFRVAKAEGYPAVSMHCTSHYSALVADKLGMRCVHELKYAEYLGEDGCPVFNPPPPHVALKSYVHVIRSPGYRIVRATVDDRPRLVKFLRQHFYRNEPLNICLGRVEGPTCSNMISQITSLHEGTSLMALELAEDGREEIIGVCLNGAATPIKKGTDTCCPLDSVIAKLVALFSVVRKRGDIWKVTGVEKMLDIQGLTVDPSKQGQGIGKALVEQAFRVAKAEGYPAVSMHCTSHYSACMAEKLGMRCVHELKYAEYLGEDGCPVFNPPPPHLALKSYVHVLT